MLELDGICKSYDSGCMVHALKPTSFTIGQGELCAIIGPSGSGKSSLMNLIGLLDEPSSGRLKLAGQDVAELSTDAAAKLRNRLLGFVFQSFELLPRLTALQNVALPLLYRGYARHDRDVRALEMLGQVGLEHRADFKPMQLSGGQRQRVAIARALVGTPALILADEPTGSLDSVTSREVMDLLVSLNRRLRMTILIVTHDPDLARRCDRQIELLDGEVVCDSGRRLVGL